MILVPEKCLTKLYLIKIYATILKNTALFQNINFFVFYQLDHFKVQDIIDLKKHNVILIFNMTPKKDPICSKLMPSNVESL
jgi:hypothetical protein